MLNRTDNKRCKSSVPLITMRLNVTLIARQYTLNSCTMLVTKSISERSYLFVATHSQDIGLLCRLVHPTRADGRDDTNRLQQQCHPIGQHFTDGRIFQHQIPAILYRCDCTIATERTTD